MEILISGSSDDLINITGCPGGDEFCNPSETLVALSGNFVAPDGTGVRLHAIYDDCWSFALGQIDEDYEWADWSFFVMQGPNAYSTEVTLDAPEGTKFIVDPKYLR